MKATIAAFALFLTLLGGCASRGALAPASAPERPNPSLALGLAQGLADSAQRLAEMGDVAEAWRFWELALDRARQVPPSDTSAARLLASRILTEQSAFLAWKVLGPLPEDAVVDGWGLVEDVVDTTVPAPDHIKPPSDALEQSDSVLFGEMHFPNPRIERAITFFTERRPDLYRRWHSRQALYRDAILAEVRRRGMPDDLLYLPMIESGYNPRATSRVGAAGVWQFMPFTARRFGLHVDYWFDERRDFTASMRAALDYLQFLHNRFGDWKLALAAYNCGEGCVDRRIRRQGTRDFWALELPRETRNYVPYILAAAFVGRRPEVWGVAGEPLLKPVVDTFTVTGGIRFQQIADSAGIDVDTLVFLNPTLVRGMTPPRSGTHILNIPQGKREKFAAVYPNLERLTKAPEPERIVHRVRSGQNLSVIADAYGTTVARLREWNRLRSNQIRAGQRLVIWRESPTIPRRRTAETSSATPVARETGTSSTAPARSHSNGSVFVVRAGQTLSEIAELHGVSVQRLREVNNLRTSRIDAGQRLRIPAGGRIQPTPLTSDPPGHHRVQPGETLLSIARRHGTTPAELQSANGLEGTDIRAGQVLFLPGAPRGESRPRSVTNERAGTHRVRQGETLAAIAEQYRMDVTTLMERNGLSTSRIRVGQLLRVDGGNQRATSSLPRESRLASTVPYRVRSGDTLYDIARSRNTTVAVLLDLNNLPDNDLQPGQILIVPAIP